MATTVGHVLYDGPGTYIGRNHRRLYPRREGIILPPGFYWGNPMRVNDDEEHTRDWAVEMYRQWIATQPRLLAALPELRGKRLLCWCRRLGETTPACHGDVLAELADSE